MEEAIPNALSQEAAARLLNWTLDTYVLPEIGRRQADGRLPDPFRLWKAQVVFDLDKPDEIRLNDEVRGVGKVRAARSVEAGQEITLDDISEWGRFELTDADPNAAHITLLPNPTGDWALMFDWQYNTALVRKHIAAAREFLDQANDALRANRLVAFPEAAFAAAELLAKSELLTLPDRAFRDAKRHGAIRARYNEWAHSGNTEQRFADLLNQLDAQRAPSRYLRGAGILSHAKAEEWMLTLRDMFDHVVEFSPDRDLDRPRRFRSLSFRAAEDIKGGEPVALASASRSSLG